MHDREEAQGGEAARNTVLVADDDATLRAVVSATFTRMGFAVTLAEDGDDALEKAGAQGFDLVMLDVRMPGADGFEVCRRLREVERYRHTPILMATGLDDHASIRRAFEAGASDFVVKPLNLTLLDHRVRFLMKAAATYGELAEKRSQLDEAMALARLAHWRYEPAEDRLHASHNGFRAYGFASDSVSIDELLVRVHPDDRAAVNAWLRAMSTSASPVAHDYRILGADDRVHRVHAVLRPLRRPDGSLLRVLGSGQDITERHALDEALRLWSRLTETTSEGMLIADGDFRPLRVNSAFGAITGHALADLQRNPAIAFPPELLALAGPELRRSGAWQGEFEARRASGEPYHQWLNLGQLRGPDGVVTHNLMTFSDITELKRSQSRLDYLAWHDPLTGLPNRAALTRHLDAVIRRSTAAGLATGVLYIDLDRFKNVNDLLGHPFGDRMLLAIVERIGAAIPSNRMLARIGGDEFIAVLEMLRGEAEAERVAAAVIASLREPFRLDHHEFAIGASIGVCACPGHGGSVDDLVRNADTAMFRAKAEGGNRYRVYNALMSADMLERMSLETELRLALARSQLALHYQPKVDLDSGAIVGAEALVRWNHPRRGLVSPSVFIPIAEECGLVADIGRWVVEEAARSAARWCRTGMPLDHIAVNVAGPQVWRSDFVDHVRTTLETNALDPSRLQIEITETLVMNDFTRDDTLRRLQALRELGMTMAIDDFGTGYSSLAYLKQLPVAILKVDQSFVRNVVLDQNDAAIVRAIVALADSLQVKLVAEGIENRDQLEWLRHAGCRVGQGHLFSRPVPAERFEAMLAPQRAGAAPTWNAAH